MIYTTALASENVNMMRKAITSKFTVVGIQLLILLLGFAAKAVVLAEFGS